MIELAEIIEGVSRLTGHLQQLVHTLEQIDDEYAQKGDPDNGARSYGTRVSKLLADILRDLDTRDAVGYRNKVRYWAQKCGSIDRIVDAGFTNSTYAVELDSLITQARDAASVLLIFEDGSIQGEPDASHLTVQRRYVEELSRLLLEEAGLLDELGRADLALYRRSEGQSLLAMNKIQSALGFFVNARARALSLLDRINFTGRLNNHLNHARHKDRLEEIELEITRGATSLVQSFS